MPRRVPRPRLDGTKIPTGGAKMSAISHTRPLATTADTRRLGGLAGMVVGPLFLTVVGLLTWAELDYLHGLDWGYTKDNPVPWPSATALGPHGWVQVLNFAVAGLLVLTFTRAFQAELHGKVGRAAAWLLYLMGVALIVSAFPTDHASTLGNSPDTWNGILHSIGFVCLALPSVIVPILVAVALRRRPGWGRLAAISAVVPAVELLLFFVGVNVWHDAAFTAYLATLFAWFALLGHRLYTTTPPFGG
jgi:Protein of unknown function (DUF998)